MIAIRKNRREKGTRDILLGSNPHSNGVPFSRSIIDFLDNKVDNKIITVEIVIKIIAVINNIIIIYINNFKPYNWKL
jgi:hypothetical protein